MFDQELALAITLLPACLADLGAHGSSFGTADRSGVYDWRGARQYARNDPEGSR
jgi:uncharacterized membrane protein YdfJ with MMPL/SSD domain